MHKSSGLHIWFYHILSCSKSIRNDRAVNKNKFCHKQLMQSSLIDTYVPASNSQKKLLNCMNNGSGLRYSYTCTMWRKKLKSYFNDFISVQRARILTNITLHNVLNNRVCRGAIIPQFWSSYNEDDSCLIFLTTGSK